MIWCGDYVNMTEVASLFWVYVAFASVTILVDGELRWADDQFYGLKVQKFVENEVL